MRFAAVRRLKDPGFHEVVLWNQPEWWEKAAGHRSREARKAGGVRRWKKWLIARYETEGPDGRRDPPLLA